MTGRRNGARCARRKAQARHLPSQAQIVERMRPGAARAPRPFPFFSQSRAKRRRSLFFFAAGRLKGRRLADALGGDENGLAEFRHRGSNRPGGAGLFRAGRWENDGRGGGDGNRGGGGADRAPGRFDRCARPRALARVQKRIRNPGRGVHQSANDVHADAVIFDPDLVFGGFRLFPVEIENQSAAPKTQVVAVFQRVDQTLGLVRGGGVEYAVAPGALEVEPQNPPELQGIEPPIRPEIRLPRGVETPLNDALALGDLLADAFFELVESRDAAHLGIALHLNQIANDRARFEIQIEQSQVGAPKPNRAVLRAAQILLAVPVPMRIQRRDDLVGQGALAFEVKPGQGQPQSLGLAAGGGNQPQGDLAGQRAQRPQNLFRRALVGSQSALKQHRPQRGMQLRDGARGNDQLAGASGDRRGRVVDEVIRPPPPAPVVVKLDAHVAIDRQRPVADPMRVENQLPLPRIQLQRLDGLQVEVRTRARNGARRPAQLAAQIRQQSKRRALRPALRCALRGAPENRPPAPSGLFVVVDKFGAVALDQPMQGDRPFASAPQSDLARGKHVQKDADMGREALGAVEKRRQRVLGHIQLGKQTPPGRGREGPLFAFCGFAREEHGLQLRAQSGQVGVEGKKTHVVAHVRIGAFLLQNQQRLRDLGSRARVENVERQLPRVRPLGQIQLEPLGDGLGRHVVGRRRGRGRAQSGANPRLQAAGVFLLDGGVHRPKHPDVAQGQKEAPVLSRNRGGKRERLQPLQQGGGDGGDGVLAAAFELFDPIGAQARPSGEPQAAQRMGRRKQNRAARSAAKIRRLDKNGVDRQRLA